MEKGAGMRAAVLRSTENLVIEERIMPEVGVNEVLIKVMDCGICGSDVHYYQHGRIGDFVVEKPMILGHECAGVVVETGKQVRNLAVGDRVAVEPGHTCGKCEFCKTGRYNLCPDVVFLATPPYDGAFAEYISYPADMAYRLPDNMDTVEGALLEPFCVGLHAAAQSEGKPGQSAVILGSGCIGLCTLLALLARGIKKVFLVDIMQKRLTMARELGAFEVINGKEQDTVAEILKRTNGEGVDLVFETAGSPFTTRQTAALVKRGGTVVLVGMAADPVYPYDFGALMGKEAKIHTVFRYCNLYPTAIDIVSSGGVKLKEIVTDYYAFEDVGKAMEDSVLHKEDMVKAVVHFG